MGGCRRTSANTDYGGGKNTGLGIKLDTARQQSLQQRDLGGGRVITAKKKGRELQRMGKRGGEPVYLNAWQ